MVAFGGTPRFEVRSSLGAGGMGVVYEAFDRERRTRVALKTLRTLSADAILRLKAEFRALRNLQHPNLVTLGELFEEGGHWFFTMELVDGVTLLKWVRQHPPPAPPRDSLLSAAGRPLFPPADEHPTGDAHPTAP